MKENLQFPTVLKRLMDERRLTNSQVAEEIGVSHVAIGNFLKGQLPKSEHLLSLARLFGVSMEELLGAGALQERGRVTASLVMESLAEEITPDLDASIAALEQEAQRFKAWSEKYQALAEEMRAERDAIAPRPGQTQYQSQFPKTPPS